MTKKQKKAEPIAEKTYNYIVACEQLGIKKDGIQLYLAKKYPGNIATLTEWQEILNKIIK